MASIRASDLLQPARGVAPLWADVVGIAVIETVIADVGGKGGVEGEVGLEVILEQPVQAVFACTAGSITASTAGANWQRQCSTRGLLRFLLATRSSTAATGPVV
jgi:hypothetical protein